MPVLLWLCVFGVEPRFLQIYEAEIVDEIHESTIGSPRLLVERTAGGDVSAIPQECMGRTENLAVFLRELFLLESLSRELRQDMKRTWR
jgi:hypothetical protein